MSLFGSWAEAAALQDLEEIKDFLGVGRQAWQAFVSQVSDPANDVRLFAALYPVWPLSSLQSSPDGRWITSPTPPGYSSGASVAP